MILLDHNVPQHEVEELRRWGIRVRQVGHEIGRPEWQDQEEIVRHLHQGKQPTFFTRDIGFVRRRFCHPNYCIVVLVCPALETAALVRRFLRHRLFRTKTARMGRVVKVSPVSIAWLEMGGTCRRHVGWSS